MKKRIVILGSGESGTGAALLAKHQGYDVFVSDNGPIKEQFKQELDSRGIGWEENQHTIDKILTASEIIKSPGIPEKSEIMQVVHTWGITVIGEIEFGYRFAGKCQIVAITGSNGKTTTTELCYHLLNTAGLNVKMGGNIGNSFARMVLEDIRQKQSKNSKRIFVLELSSFQLDDIQQFRPKIAILLNISPDHLDRYENNLDNYVRSKFRITMNQKRGDKFIYNGFDAAIKAQMAMPEQLWKNETKPNAMAIRKGAIKNTLIKVAGQVFDLTKSPLRGLHNMFNAACAIRTALLLGVDAQKIAAAINTFSPPPHRLEKVAEIAGVTWVNDSKATNVDAVFYALQSMESPIVWIVGGQDKGNDYSQLLKLVKKNVKAIICMGVDNAKIIKVFGNMKKPIRQTSSAAEAVKEAAKIAKSGDTVLLSPACASFDLFENYEDRGDQFKHEVFLMMSDE